MVRGAEAERMKDFLKLVLQEKVDFLAKVIPIIESVAPYLPPDARTKAEELAEVLKIAKGINEGLLQAPIWRLAKAYASLKASRK